MPPFTLSGIDSGLMVVEPSAHSACATFLSREAEGRKVWWVLPGKVTPSQTRIQSKRSASVTWSAATFVISRRTSYLCAVFCPTLSVQGAYGAPIARATLR